MERVIRSPPSRTTLAAGLLALAALAGCDAGNPQSEARVREAEQAEPARVREIGLSTSLPILWRETDDVADLLKQEAPAHWAAAILGNVGTVRPLDSLDAGPDGQLPLGPDALLVLAQPYPFSPGENLALDNWVRAGGQVLLFADPMLTFESAFALGDRRRPQDVALLSPILARWGLELRFDDAQEAGLREIAVSGGLLPVNLPGAFRFLPGYGESCAIEAQGLLAECRVGKGRVLAVADAALFETTGPQANESRTKALARLLERISD